MIKCNSYFFMQDVMSGYFKIFNIKNVKMATFQWFHIYYLRINQNMLNNSVKKNISSYQGIKENGGKSKQTEILFVKRKNNELPKGNIYVNSL